MRPDLYPGEDRYQSLLDSLLEEGMSDDGWHGPAGDCPTLKRVLLMPREEQMQFLLALLVRLLWQFECRGRAAVARLFLLFGAAKLVLARTHDGKEIKTRDLKAEGSLVVILKHALLPNLAQTMEGSPAIIHSGPFANIAHGTSSVLGTWAGLNRSDIIVQEAGFGADLGAEKFMNIFCPAAQVAPSAIVVVCTIRAMRYHGGVPKDKIAEPNPQAVEKGLSNPLSHIKNMQAFGIPVMVAINQRHDDSPEELKMAFDRFAAEGVQAVGHTCFAEGGAGGEDMARKVAEMVESSNGTVVKPSYQAADPLKVKIEKL